MISIDFKNFNERGLKKVINAFEKQDLHIKEVVANNRPKRESGYQTKAATLHFESGQKLLLKAKANGSIFQVKLNNKAIPIKHVDDLKKAVGEVITFVKKNEPKFLKQQQTRLAKKRVQIPKPKPATTSAKKQLEQVSGALTSAKEENEALGEELQGLTEEIEDKQTTLANLRARLDEETQRSETLQAELDALKEAA